MIICISLCCFIDDVDDPYESKTGLNPTIFFFLLIVPRRFFVRVPVFLYVMLVFICDALHIFASGRLCFVIVAFIVFLSFCH